MANYRKRNLSDEELWVYMQSKLTRKTDTCWIWLGATHEKGYGQFWFQKKVRPAHVIAFLLSGKVLSPGEYVCHTCDNPSCINPDHLFAGSQYDNMQDMKSKDRSARLAGEKNGRSKLTESQVQEIRIRIDSHSDLAREFGVSHTTIMKIRKRALWK